MDDSSANPLAGAANQLPTAPQAGDPEPQAGEGSTTTTETISLDAAKKLRSENENLRKRMKEADALLAELKTFKEQTEAASLSDAEKRDRATKQREEQFTTLQRERDSYQQQLKQARLDTAISALAHRQGIDPKLATRLLDASAVEYDESGSPTNLEAAFRAMVKEFGLTPRTTLTSGGATNPPRSQTSASAALSWDAIGKMAPEEYQARRAEIVQWMANNPRPR